MKKPSSTHAFVTTVLIVLVFVGAALWKLSGIQPKNASQSTLSVTDSYTGEVYELAIVPLRKQPIALERIPDFLPSNWHKYDPKEDTSTLTYGLPVEDAASCEGQSPDDCRLSNAPLWFTRYQSLDDLAASIFTKEHTLKFQSSQLHTFADFFAFALSHDELYETKHGIEIDSAPYPVYGIPSIGPDVIVPIPLTDGGILAIRWIGADGSEGDPSIFHTLETALTAVVDAAE